MVETFEFEDSGRRFCCSVEPLRQSSPEAWWWFSVSLEEHARYAPFRVEKGDTQRSVQSRVVQYYDELLRRRAEPPVNRWKRGAPGQAQPAAPAGAPAAAPAAKTLES